MKFNTVLRWLYILKTPIIIACLCFVPFDIVSSIFWAIAFFYIIGIGIKFLIKLYRVFIKNEKDKFILAYTLKFILSVIAFAFAIIMIDMSITSATEKALHLAINMKKYVLKNGQCTEIKKDTIRYGNYGTQYNISYTCDTKEKIFSYQVRINHDDYFRIEYLNNGKLKGTFGHKSDMKSMYFDETSNLHELAKGRI